MQFIDLLLFKNIRPKAVSLIKLHLLSTCCDYENIYVKLFRKYFVKNLLKVVMDFVRSTKLKIGRAQVHLG